MQNFCFLSFPLKYSELINVNMVTLAIDSLYPIQQHNKINIAITALYHKANKQM